MAMVENEKELAIRELQTKFEVNQNKLKQVHAHYFVDIISLWPSFFAISSSPPADHIQLILFLSPLQLESQKRQNEIMLRRAAFTAAHLDELPDNVATYRSIGKAWVIDCLFAS